MLKFMWKLHLRSEDPGSQGLAGLGASDPVTESLKRYVTLEEVTLPT